MAENVNIKLDADIASFLVRMKQAEKALKSFKREQGKTLASSKKGLSSGADDVDDFTERIDHSFVRMKKHFDNFDKGTKMMGTGLLKFLGKGIKFTLIQLGLMSVALVAIHGAFLVGQGIMKGYQFIMKGLAGAAASAAIALSTAAAAVREQQAAMFAYKGGGMAQFGSGLNQTRVAMRSYATDASLAGLGTKNLQKAYAEMAKTMNSGQIAGSKGIYKSLQDFGAAGQDPGAAQEKIGALIATLNDAKKGYGDVQAAAKKLGPEMEKALKDSKVKTKEGFKELLLSGELAKKGGVFGQFDAVNSTLIGQAKTFFGLLKEQFADFGQQFLEPAKQAMQKIFKIIKDDFLRVTAELQVFGSGTFFDTLVSVVEKLSSFFVKLVREWLPQAKGIFGSLSEWINRFKRGWDDILEKLRPFIDGAKIIEKTLKPIIGVIGKEGAASFKEFNNQLKLNEKNVLEFGDRIADLLSSFFKMSTEFKKMFFDALPFINDMVKGLTQVFDMLRGILTKFTSLGGATGGLMAFSIMARQMKGTKGGLLPSANTQTMNVGTLNVSNAPGLQGTPKSPVNPFGPGRPAPIPGGPGTMPSGPGGPFPFIPQTYRGQQPQVPTNPQSPGLSSGAFNTTPNGLLVPTGLKSGADAGDVVDKRQKMAPNAGRMFSVKTLYPRFKEGIKENLSRKGVDVSAGSKEFMGMRNRLAEGVQYIKNKDYVGLLKNGAQSARNMGVGGKMMIQSLAAPAVGPGGIADASYGGMLEIDKETNMPKLGGADGKQYVTRSRLTGKTKFIDPNKTSMRMMRAGRFGSAILGNEKAGITGLNNTMGAKMGAGIGLSMMSQYAPEEMRGAMALGGTIGAFNPLAGLAVAGLGGAMKAQGAGSGALAGAGGGAAIGTMIAPGVGTAIGAAIGGIGGFIMGGANKLKAQAKAAKETMGAALDGVAQAVFSDKFMALARNAKIVAEGGVVTGKGALEGIGSDYRKRLSGVSGTVDKAKEMGATDKTSWGRNIGSAALMGLGGGAAAGTVLGPIGTAVFGALGLVGGAITGTLFSIGDWAQGWFRGDSKKAKAQKNALKEIYDKQKELGITISEEQYKTMLKDKEAALTKFQTQFKMETEASEMLDRTYSSRLDELQKITGKTRPELELMAQTMGVDLYDGTVKFNDVLTKLGLNIEKTAIQMRQANTDVFIKGGSEYEKMIEQIKAPMIYDEVIAALDAQMSGAGGASDIDILSATQKFGEASLSLMGGNPLLAYFDNLEQIGTKQDPGKLFQKGGAMEGQQDKYFTDKVTEAQGNARKSQITGFADTAAGQLASKLSANGMSVDQEALKGKILSMDRAKQEELLLKLQDGTFNMGQMTEGGSRESYGQAAERKFTSLFGSTEGLAINQRPEAKLNETATTMETASKDFKLAVDKFVGYAGQIVDATKSNYPSWLTNQPSWWAAGPNADTSSPRGKSVGDTTSSRLSQTMARHASMDGMLSGKRTVTSSYRTFALGSPSSDHVTGRAIDLVGANLGQYKALAEANGGFAEFHGRGASRHLHVVPGPGAIGDTMAPVGAGTSRGLPISNTGGGTSYFTININGSNSSPDEIANKVMAKLRDKERASRERG
ncbi:hypothetical protein UFOVP658_142 [uncultured Caudovirales phage]|uniref:Uncharacterized protein n=1 Tax=uncultured Caudovirales phage TaxID=2100421 RepID=A0A6J5ND44_9CAUD|nr:hypothetical protein UFOVP658_142 [uncultured Caudovirales phage]